MSLSLTSPVPAQEIRMEQLAVVDREGLERPILLDAQAVRVIPVADVAHTLAVCGLLGFGPAHRETTRSIAVTTTQAHRKGQGVRSRWAIMRSAYLAA